MSNFTRQTIAGRRSSPERRVTFNCFLYTDNSCRAKLTASLHYCCQHRSLQDCGLHPSLGTGQGPGVGSKLHAAAIIVYSTLAANKEAFCLLPGIQPVLLAWPCSQAIQPVLLAWLYTIQPVLLAWPYSQSFWHGYTASPFGMAIQPVLLAWPRRQAIQPVLLAWPRRQAIQPVLLAWPRRQAIQPVLLAWPQRQAIQPVLLALPINSGCPGFHRHPGFHCR